MTFDWPKGFSYSCTSEITQIFMHYNFDPRPKGLVATVSVNKGGAQDAWAGTTTANFPPSAPCRFSLLIHKAFRKFFNAKLRSLAYSRVMARGNKTGNIPVSHLLR